MQEINHFLSDALNHGALVVRAPYVLLRTSQNEAHILIFFVMLGGFCDAPSPNYVVFEGVTIYLPAHFAKSAENSL